MISKECIGGEGNEERRKHKLKRGGKVFLCVTSYRLHCTLVLSKGAMSEMEPSVGNADRPCRECRYAIGGMQVRHGVSAAPLWRHLVVRSSCFGKLL